jgi:uncharacterized glyoxalase superfamily protein PhnB
VAASATSEHVGIAPVLVVRDIERSLAYFRDALGFDLAFIYGEPTFYAGVCRGSVTIHLQSATSTDRQPGQAGISIFTSDVDALYEELRERGAEIVKPPADYDYGMRDFDVRDPDGNALCFGTESRGADPSQ